MPGEDTFGMADSYRELPPLGLGPPPDLSKPPGVADGRIHPGSGRTPLRKKAGGLLAPLAALAVKAKALLLLAGNFKLLATFGSMAVSVVAYGWLFGFTFPIGLLLPLLLH